jgi:hypothetical protein
MQARHLGGAFGRELYGAEVSDEDVPILRAAMALRRKFSGHVEKKG